MLLLLRTSKKMSDLPEIIKRERGEIVKVIYEEWRPCYIDKEYEVSNLGMIKRKARLLKSGKMSEEKYYLYNKRYKNPENKERWYWTLTINGKVRQVHQLIFFSFYPHLYKDRYYTEFHIDHINGISEDNRLVNLRWLPALENSLKGRKDHSNGLF